MNNLKLFSYGLLTGLIIILLYNNYQFKKKIINLERISLNKKQQITNNIDYSRNNAITRAIALTNSAVVGINVIKLKKQLVKTPFSGDPFFNQFFKPKYYNKPVKSVGSGFLISADGYIITNEHVIHNATDHGIIITTTEGKEYNARIIGADEGSDIAVLKIDPENADLPYLEKGSSKNALIGEWVIAFGNPYGLFQYIDKPLITVGVISGLKINFSRSGNHFYEDMIQTDASINPGNSGGPLVNAEGKVIGMNTMVYSNNEDNSGIGFAIPIEKVFMIKDILISEGYVNRNIYWGFILKEQLYLDNNNEKMNGVAVYQIHKGSTAEKAGFKLGDIITAVENYRIDNFKDIKVALLEARDYKVGDEIEFTVLRNGERRKITMKLESKKF